MQDEVKHAHCIGAGGIGVSAVAKFLLSRGVAVSGSDTVRSAMTDDLAARGATITIGHDAANIPASCDLVVYTEAAGEDNVERAEAARRGIRQLGHFGFLGELAKTMRTICVTGTNGKSTTTAMTGKIFEDAGMDPTVFVGSLVPGWELGNLRIGASDILIVEGDEYKRKVLALHPETTLVTNVELDHTDVYKDLADMEAMFRQLGMQTTKTFFHNAADRARRIYRGDGTATLKFFGDAMDAEPRRFEGGYQLLRLYRSRGFLRRRAIIGDLMLQIPGAFNMMNALAALAIASEYGIGAHIALQTLMNFTGIWRRFERVGTCNGADVISDYGHHPTAITGTLAAAKEFFPGRRIVLAFQPHQHNRTKELFDEFVTAFDDADVLILTEIYGVQGRTDEADAISSMDLLNAIQQRIPAGSGAVRPMEYAQDLDATEAKLRAHLRDGDVVIVMGAGDIDEVARRLVQ